MKISMEFEKISNNTKSVNITGQIIKFFETTLKTNKIFEKRKFRFTLIISTKSYNF